jgi:hypothetical protein
VTDKSARAQAERKAFDAQFVRSQTGIGISAPTQGQGSRSSSASAQGSRRTKPGLTDGARFALRNEYPAHDDDRQHGGAGPAPTAGAVASPGRVGHPPVPGRGGGGDLRSLSHCDRRNVPSWK